LDINNDGLFRAVFRSLESAQTVASETLCQLYEIHNTLKCFRADSYRNYALPKETVRTLKYHYRKARDRKRKLSRNLEKLHEDIADVLRDVVIDFSVSRQYQTSVGFCVDVAILQKKDSRALVLLEIDGDQTLMRSLDPPDLQHAFPMCRVRGHILLKRRVLHGLGFTLAVITEEQWCALEDSREKRDFVREILRHCGVSKNRLKNSR